MITIDTLDDEYMVEETTYDIETQEAMPQDGNHSAYKSLQDPHVLEVKQEEDMPRDVHHTAFEAP